MGDSVVSLLLQVRCQNMSRTKYLKGECQHCGGHLEFLADHIGMVVTCPHCGQETELLLLQPPEVPSIPRRALIWTGFAVVVLCLGLVGALMALKRAERWAANQKHQTIDTITSESSTNAPPVSQESNSAAQDGLLTSAVSLDQAKDTSLVYAVGTVKNNSSRQRFGLRVVLELDDPTGQKIGAASDYRQVLEPGAEWQFKALVLDSKTKSARITSIREEQ
jgi:lysine biosynthesis protein LysW